MSLGRTINEDKAMLRKVNHQGEAEEETIVDDEDDEDENVGDQDVHGEDGDAEVIVEDDKTDRRREDHLEGRDSPIVVVTCPDEDDERIVRRGSRNTIGPPNIPATSVLQSTESLHQRHNHYTSVAADLIDRRQRAAAARAAAAAMLQRYDLDRIVAAERSLLLERYLQQQDQRSYRHAISLRFAQQQQQQQRLRAEGILRQSQPNSNNDRQGPNSTANSYLSPTTRAAHSLLKQPQQALMRHSSLLDCAPTDPASVALRTHAKRQSERFRSTEKRHGQSSTSHHDVIEIESSTDEDEAEDVKRKERIQKDSTILVDQDEEVEEMQDDEDDIADDATTKYHQLALMALNAKYTCSKTAPEKEATNHSQLQDKNIKDLEPVNGKRERERERERKTVVRPKNKEQKCEESKHEKEKEDTKTSKKDKGEKEKDGNERKTTADTKKDSSLPKDSKSYKKSERNSSDDKPESAGLPNGLTIADQVNMARKQATQILQKTNNQKQKPTIPDSPKLRPVATSQKKQIVEEKNRNSCGSETEVSIQKQTSVERKQTENQDTKEKRKATDSNESQEHISKRVQTTNHTSSPKQTPLKITNKLVTPQANSKVVLPHINTQNHAPFQNGHHRHQQALSVSPEANRLVHQVAATANKFGNTKAPSLSPPKNEANKNPTPASLPSTANGTPDNNQTNLAYLNRGVYREVDNNSNSTNGTNRPSSPMGLNMEMAPLGMAIQKNSTNNIPQQPIPQILDINLAGPFVHGIITNNIHMLQSLDGIAGQLADVHDIVLHQTISKLLFKLTMAEPTYTCASTKENHINDGNKAENEGDFNENIGVNKTENCKEDKPNRNLDVSTVDTLNDGVEVDKRVEEDQTSTKSIHNKEKMKKNLKEKNKTLRKRKWQQIETPNNTDNFFSPGNSKNTFDRLNGGNTNYESQTTRGKNEDGTVKKNVDLNLSVTVGDIEEIAEAFVTERRQCIRQAVQIAFLEMRKRHDVILNATRNHYGSINDAVDSLETVKRERKMDEASHSQKLLQMKQMFQQEMKQLQQQHEDFVAKLIKEHGNEIATLKDEIQDLKRDHDNSLGWYMEASCNALRTLRESTEPKRII